MPCFTSCKIFRFDKLINTLEKLQNKTSNLGLGNVGTQLKNIQKAASGFGEEQVRGLDRILTALEKLQNVSSFKISSSIANQIKGIGEAAKGLNGTDFTGIGNLADSLSKLSTVGEVNISSALNQLNRIPKIAESLKSVDISAFAGKIKEITEALKPLATEMEKVSKGFSAFPDKLKKVIEQTDKIPNTNKRAADSYTDLSNKVKDTMRAVEKTASVIAKMINLANESIESQNLFNVAMGQYAEEAREYAETVSASLGIDPAEWMENQGLFMTLSTGFGVAGDKTAEMSKNLTQLGYDLSSFYNISTDDAFQKLQSGLAGEIEPMRRLGYDLSQAKLQSIALSKGITKNVSDMTQAEKALLRYYAIMTQVTQVQGDMARTIDQPANQLRVLRSAVTQAARALGNLFLPIVQKVVPWHIAGANAVTKFANGLAALLGIKGVDDSVNFEGIINGAEGTEGAFNGATEAAAKFKKMLLGIDELNVLNDDTGTTSGAWSGTGAIGKLPGVGGSGSGTPGSGGGGSGIPGLEIPSLAVTIKDVFFDWENITPESVAEKLLTGLGAVIGGMAGFSLLGGLKGGILGVAVGAALSLILSSIIFDHDGKLNKSEITQTLLPILGAILGFAITMSPVGGLIGLGIGAAISLLIEKFSIDKETGDFSSEVWSGMKDLIIRAFAGAGIGFILGGPSGALIGAAVGTVVSLTLHHLGWNGADGVNVNLTKSLLPFLLAAGGGVIGFALGGPAGAAIGATVGVGISMVVNAIDWEGAGEKIDTFVSNVKGKFESLGAKISGIITSNKDLLLDSQIQAFEGQTESYIIPTREDFTNLFGWLGEKYTENKDALLEAQIQAFEGQTESYMMPTREDFANLFSFLNQSYTELKTNIVTQFNTAKNNVVSNFITPLRNQVVSLASSMKSQFQSTCNNIASAFQTARNRAQAAFEGLASWFSSNVVSPIQSMLSRISSAISSVISSASRAVSAVSGLFSSRNRTSVSGYATGGFPSTGEVFIANEKGPELVGRIGNQSAVANGNQIITGITQGVYNAVVAANSTGGRSGDIKVYVNGKQIMTAVAEEARRETVRTGVNPLTQGG